ncbi:hypothetical protein D3C86_850870 [compost metagenome]
MDVRLVQEGIALIEFGGALMVVAFCTVAVWSVLWEHEPVRARHWVALGAIMGLNFKLAATLLKTLYLVSWSQVGMLAFVIGLRTVLKWTFVRERGGLPGD